MSGQEHPFSRFIKILGKGRNGMRALTQQEAYEAMGYFTRYEVEPEQLGAFMSLLRVKEETAEELAGFTRALRESMVCPSTPTSVAIDWPAYAGKRRQLPWFLLAVLALAQNGYPVFMHGLSRDDERLYAEQALNVLGITDSKSLNDAAMRLSSSGFAYMKIGNLSAVTAELMETRELLGLRSPINTVVRLLNPMSAPLMMQGVFHPNYAPVHQQAGLLLQQPLLVAFRGEGGEAERVPERECLLYGTGKQGGWQQTWPALMPPDNYNADRTLDLDHFVAVWQGAENDRYAEAAVIGTIAIVLMAMERCVDQQQAWLTATEIWNHRQPGLQAIETGLREVQTS